MATTRSDQTEAREAKLVALFEEVLDAPDPLLTGECCPILEALNQAYNLGHGDGQADALANQDALHAMAFERGYAQGRSDERAERWVPCEERMPTARGLLMFSKNGVVYAGTYNAGDWYDLACPDGHDDMVGGVTHWQPWPPPPASARGEVGRVEP